MRIFVSQVTSSVERKKRPLVAKRRKVERRKNARERRNSGHIALIVNLSTGYGSRQRKERRRNSNDRRRTTIVSSDYTLELSSKQAGFVVADEEEKANESSEGIESSEFDHHIHISA